MAANIISTNDILIIGAICSKAYKSRTGLLRSICLGTLISYYDKGNKTLFVKVLIAKGA